MTENWLLLEKEKTSQIVLGGVLLWNFEKRVCQSQKKFLLCVSHRQQEGNDVVAQVNLRNKTQVYSHKKHKHCMKIILLSFCAPSL